MIKFVTEEDKRAFIQAFNKYVELERKKKRLASDSKIVLNDFFNITFTGLDKYSKKLKKKEFSKCTRTKEEVRTLADPVEAVEQLRVSHLEVPENSLDYYDEIVEDKLEAKREAKRVGKEQKQLIQTMRRNLIETEDVCTAVIKKLASMSLGKLDDTERISKGVAEGKAILFNVEATEEGSDD